MRYLLGLLAFAVYLQAAPPQTGKTQKSAAKDSLKGCVDERDGQYVLTNDTDLQPIARLQPAAGSPEDNFARHMGHKVTVRGKISKEGSLPVMTVMDVETVSQTCAPSTGTKSQ
jgi:hypothetical protein